MIDGISFCIPTNGKRQDKIKILIQSIKKQEGLPIEIIICGETSGLTDIGGIKLISFSEEANNRKVSFLRNRAAEQSKYSVIAWCDDDIILNHDWLKNNINYFSNNDWDVLGNVILGIDGGRFWDRATYTPHIIVDYEHDYKDKNLYQTATFFLMKKSVCESVKWDENLFAHVNCINTNVPEDVKYSMDLYEKKYYIKFNKTAKVWHNDEKYRQINNCVFLDLEENSLFYSNEFNNNLEKILEI